MLTREVTINNQVGLHARPATFFIQKANEFKSSIWIEKDDRKVNAKSLLGVLSLGIVKGTSVTLVADGSDEKDALNTLAAIGTWREAHADVSMRLIRGNHDRRAGDPPEALKIEVVAEPWLVGPFALQHEPQPHATHHVLAGHVHPTFRLRGKGRQSVRAPCFCLGPRISLLPAFGAFTGGMNVSPAPGTRLYLVADEGVWPLTHD